MSPPFSGIPDALRSAERVLLLGHVRPDGDAIGSQLALAISLSALGKTTVAWNEDGCPENLLFLPESERIERPPEKKLDFDVVVALDTATKQRLGTTLNSIGAVACWINVDHHASNPSYGDLNYIDTTAPATGQIVYELIRHADFPFSPAMADALYVAISTDTGSFRYANTTTRTFQVAGELIAAGARNGELSRLLYYNYPKRRLLLLGELLEQARFGQDGRLASLSLDLKQKAHYGVHPEDIDGLIDSIRSVDSVVAALFFEELPDNRVRVSMRSKDERMDVNRICQVWGGGGHKLAAGARIRGSLSEVTTSVWEYVAHEISQNL
jgi:phosphoesterase RecJ-like protein